MSKLLEKQKLPIINGERKKHLYVKALFCKNIKHLVQLTALTLQDLQKFFS